MVVDACEWLVTAARNPGAGGWNPGNSPIFPVRGSRKDARGNSKDVRGNSKDARGTSPKTNAVEKLDSFFADPDLELLRGKLNEMILRGTSGSLLREGFQYRLAVKVGWQWHIQ